ncbi:hypothetical protein [Raineya orbicola]|uniref:Uncharacterized protein n=1 Tax=Raineya orbicola TaxID=2016530 RepID=A0A2N3IHK7_9BACT|nr:hypothetical protein [Raineya orbicola]PKQ69797.1 hypothetical protein Rain11_1132 [Raineya orbicola]
MKKIRINYIYFLIGAIPILFYIFGVFYDNIRFNNGLGFDGATYGYYVKECIVQNINNYYAHRILPSLITKLFLNIFNIVPTDETIFTTFHILNIVFFTFSIVLFFKISQKTNMSLKRSYFVITLVFFNFFFLKNAPFYPVLTDYSAFFLSTLLLYSYIFNKPILTFFCFLSGVLTFPTIAPMVFVLFFVKKNNSIQAHNNLLTRLIIWMQKKRVITIVIYLIPLIYAYLALRLLFVWIPDISNYYFWSTEKLNIIISIISMITNVLVLITLLYTYSNYLQKKLITISKEWDTNLSYLFILISCLILIETILKYFVINPEIQSPTNSIKLIETILLMSVQRPLLAIFSHIFHWGGLVIISLIFYKKIIENAEKYGYGMLLLLMMHSVLFIFISETRLLIGFLPFLAFLTAISIPENVLSTNFLAIHSIISVIISRFWLKFDDLGISSDINLDSWYFLGGPWTKDKGYFILAIVSIILFLVYGLLTKKNLKTL